MAENNPIRNSYNPGTLPDISAIVGVLTDLNVSTRETLDVLRQLRPLVSQVEQNTKSGSKSTDSNNTGITATQLEDLFKTYVVKGLSLLSAQNKKLSATDSSSRRVDYNFEPFGRRGFFEAFESESNNYLKSLGRHTTTYIDTEKNIRNLNQTIKLTSDKLFKINPELDLGSLQNTVNELGDLTNEFSINLKNPLGSLQKLYVQLGDQETTLKTKNNSLQKIYEDLNNLEKQENKVREQLSKDISEAERNKYEAELENIQKLQEYNNESASELEEAVKLQELKIKSTKKSIELEENSNQNRVRIIERSLEQAEQLLAINTDLGDTRKDLENSRKNLIKSQLEYSPESMKLLDKYITGFQDFINPQDSEEFKSRMLEFDSTIEQHQKALMDIENKKQSTMDQKKSNENDIRGLEYSYNFEEVNLDDLKSLYESAEKSGNKELMESYSKQIKESEEKLNNIKLEKEFLEKANKLLDEQVANIEAEEKLTENKIKELKDTQKKIIDTTNLTTNIIKKAADGLFNLIKKAVDRELDNLMSSADRMFDSFEKTQQEIGKTLKMSSGAYADFAKQMVEAASEAGLSITTEQVNEAAANLVEMGVSNQNLIKEFAVAQAKITQAGSSIKLDEETIKQLQSGYFKNIREGKTEEEASEILRSTFEEMIAAEQWVREEFGSTTALSTGGSEEIEKWADKLIQAGKLTVEDYGNFYASMGGFMQAMENEGMDSSVILQDLESLLENPMSELSPQLMSWLQSNNLGINNTEDLYNMLAEGDFGKVAADLLGHEVKQFEGMSATDLAYVGKAYGSSATQSQMVGMQASGEQAIANYEFNEPTEEALQDVKENTMNGLKEGTYLTATEKLENINMGIMEDVALIAQKLPDGKYWMDYGLEGMKNITNSALSFGLGMLTKGLFKNLGLDSLGGGTTELTPETNSILKGLGKGLKDFAIGNKSTVAGKIGSYGTMGVGGVMSIGSAVKDIVSGIKEGKSSEDLWIDTLRDPTFTKGLGVTIGGAIAGPVGGALGGLAGSIIPTLSQGLEDLLVNTFLEPEKDIWAENSAQLEKAATSLAEAGDKHKLAAEGLKTDIEKQKGYFEEYTQDQKIEFLKKSDLYSTQSINLANEDTINKYFETATKKWIEDQEKIMKKEELLSTGTENVANVLGDIIDYENVQNYTAKDIKKINDEELRQIGLSAGLSEEEALNLRTLDYEEVAKILNEAQEKQADYAAFSKNEGTEKLLQDIEEYAKLEGIDTTKTKTLEDGTVQYTGLEDAIEQYFTAIDTEGLYSEEDKQYIKEMFSQYTQGMESWESDNELFQNRLTELLDSNDNIKTYEDLIKAYENTYGEILHKEKVFENVEKDTTGIISIGGIKLSEEVDKDTLSKVVSLRKSSTTGAAFDKTKTYGNWIDLGNTQSEPEENIENPENLADGSHKTGLDYVPVDDYIALLHQGEMVLNEPEASSYRENTPQTLSDLTKTLDNQTILNEELQNLLLTFSTDTNKQKTENNLSSNKLSEIYTNLVKSTEQDISKNMDTIYNNVNIVQSPTKIPLLLNSMETESAVQESTNSLYEQTKFITEQMLRAEASSYKNSNSEILSNYMNMENVASVISQYSNNKKNNTDLDISPVTNSVNAQTDKIVDILTKILQILTAPPNSSKSYLPRNLVQMNSNISLL